MGRVGKGTGKRMRSSKQLNGDQALTNHAKPAVTEEVSQPDIVPMNGEGLNGDNNMDEVLVHETTSNVIDKQGMTSDEWKAAMEAIEAEWKKLVADVTNTSNMPINKDTGSKEDTPIVKSVSFTKSVSYVKATGASSSKPSAGKTNFRHLVSDNVFVGVELSIPMNVVQTFNSIKGLEDVLESGPWMIRNSPIILKKWTMNTRPCKEELTLIPVWVKIHDVSIQVFLEDGISLIASQIEALGMRIRMETVRVEYKWKPPRCEQCKIFGHMNDQYPKNATTVPNVMNDDGFQTVVNKKKSGKTGFTVVKTTWQLVNQK
ncbi:zinc knuckle CX2CX4HX4C containing protein, partial [Tanacetum coccineum]